MADEWQNWSGGIRCRPSQTLHPESDDEVADALRRAAADGAEVRTVAAGHSFTPLAATDDTMISLDRMTGLLEHDPDAGTATIGAGTTVGEAKEELADAGLAMENTGDIDQQTVVGAIATGTHGTGKRLTNLAGPLVGARLVTVDGTVRDVDESGDPELIRALRVSLGALGVMTRATLRVLPHYRLERQEFCVSVRDCFDRYDELVDRNRHFDFYWFPRRDEVRMRLVNLPGETPEDLQFGALYRSEEGAVGEVLPRPQEIPYEEMEYLLPAEAGPAAFEEVRARIKERWRRIVGWRVLYRTIAADDGFLSPAAGRDSVSIAVLQNVSLPFREYFADIERIFRRYDGRPHWAKHHNLDAEELRSLYPEWDRFAAIREELDPEGVLLNRHLRHVLGVPVRAAA
jgi:FAD/FMN-containing dehydrogenase